MGGGGLLQAQFSVYRQAKSSNEPSQMCFLLVNFDPVNNKPRQLGGIKQLFEKILKRKCDGKANNKCSGLV